MNRVVRFRAWDMVDGCYLPQDVVNDSPLSSLMRRPCVVEQYTGLNDIEGTEIYEGDIISLLYIKDEGGGWRSNSKETGVVYFDNNWGVKFDCPDKTQRTAESHWKIKGSTFRNATEVKVIGNIHQNPSLLK